MHAHVAQHALDRMVAQIAVAAVQLQAAVDHLEADIGREAAWPARQAACAPGSRCVDRDSRRAAPSAAPPRARSHSRRRETRSAWKSASRVPNCLRSRMYSMVRSRQNCAPPIEQAAMLSRPPSSPAIAILKPSPFAADQVRGRHAAVLEHHHRGRLRLPAELLLLRAEGEPGRALLHHDAGDAAAARPRRCAPCRHRRRRRRRRR